MMQRSSRAVRVVNALGMLVAFAAGPVQGAGHPGRPEAPAKPTKGEYTWAEPKDWTPPTLDELQKWQWTAGPVMTNRKIAEGYYAKNTPQITEAEALQMENSSPEANEKMLSALSRPPKSDDEVDWDATFNRRAEGAPNTLNYVLYSSGVEDDICTMIYALPVFFDYEFNLIADGDVVVEWKRTPTADMLVLRDDLTWEDGAPYTAWDIEFTYHAILDERINVPAVRSGTDELKWVKAYDAKTIVFFHKEAKGTNALNIAIPILPKHIYSPGLAEDPTMATSEWNVYWNFHPLASAAYKLVEHQPHQFVLLERREDFYQDKSGKQIRDKPYMKYMRFRIVEDNSAAMLALAKGELDEKRLLSREWTLQTSDADFKRQNVKVNGVDWGYNYFGWSQKPVPDVPFFKDKRVRWAMTYALNHKEMQEKINFNLLDPGAGPFHPESWMANPEVKPIQQDLDKAEALLDEAGWTDSDQDGVRDKTIDGKKWKFEFTMEVPVGGVGEQYATLLKEDLDTIGVKVNIKTLEWATFTQNQHDHKSQAFAAAWGTGIDPDTAKNLFQTKEYEAGRNYVAYANPEVDKLFDEAGVPMDREARRPYYQKIHKLIADDQPYTFLNFRRALWSFNKRLRGYIFSPRNPFRSSPGPFAIWTPKKP